VWSGLSKMTFMHLHGSLGSLPEQVSNVAGMQGSAIPFGASDDSDPDVAYRSIALQHAEQNVRIVHDAQNIDNFASAGELLKGAQQIVFLGFAFGKENVERLRLLDNVAPNKDLFCTTYGMTQAEIQDRVDPSFPHRLAGSYAFGLRSKDLLRERISIFR
jgi:hypothetical protein